GPCAPAAVVVPVPATAGPRRARVAARRVRDGLAGPVLFAMPKEATKTKTRKAAGKAEKAPRGSRKATKDPKAPKRALSAYMFFSQDWRERIKTENPDASFGEVGKLLGAKWKELDDSEKKPYVEQAARDKTRAEQEKAEYDGGKAAAADEDDDE
ncbi:hypothetical protein EVG20_g5531, partial [Dentipellis fragilis]